MTKKQDAGKQVCGEADPKTDPAERAFSSVSKTIGDIRQVRQRMNHVVIQSLYEIGKILIRDGRKLSNADEHSEIYGKDFWERFSEEVKIHEKTLEDCKRFAEKFDESQVREMVEREMNWTHVVHLLSLRTVQEREAFLKRVAEEGLTAVALQKEIAAKYGNRRPGSGKQKKPPEPPKSLSSGLKRAQDKVSRLNAEHEHALFCDEFDLAAEIETGPADEITEDTSDQVDHLIDQYRILAATAPDILRRLEQSRRRIERVFAERERAEKEPDTESGKRLRSVVLTAAEPAGADRTGLPVEHSLAK